MKLKLLITQILLILTTHQTQPQKSISALNLLLPLSDTPMSTTLTAYNGCYTWTSSNPEILKLTPLKKNPKNPSCISSITVQVNTTTPHQNTIWISATDSETGHTLNCEAKIAQISTLEILTKQKSILVEDFETLELLGKDRENNVFTTLEGIAFEWRIEQNKSLAEFQTFKNSLKQTTRKRQNLEDTGVQTDIVVLKGLDTGKIKVHARFRTQGTYVKTRSDLSIIENFVLVPQNTVYLTLCDQIQYQLFKIRKENSQMNFLKVSLPSKQHKWSLLNENKGVMSQGGLLSVSKSYGSSFVEVQDISNKENKIKNQVHFVKPYEIDIQVVEYESYTKQVKSLTTGNLFQRQTISFQNNWYLIQGKKYYIRVDLKDDNGNRILFEKFKSQFKFDQKSLQLVEQGKDFLVVKALKLVQNGKLDVQMNFKKCQDLVINSFKHFNVHSQLKLLRVKSGVLNLPYYDQRSQQTYKLRAIGGSNQYNFETDDKTVLKVNINGQADVQKVGQAILTCRDQLNPHNFDSITFEITDVQNLDFLEHKKESLVDQETDLFITGFNFENEQFSNCTSVDYNKVLDENQGEELKVDLDYEQLIERIDTFMGHHQFKIQKFINYYDYDEVNYQQFIENSEISTQELKRQLGYYKNFGICDSVRVKPAQVGEYENHIQYQQNEHNKSKLKVFQNYEFRYPVDYSLPLYGQTIVIAPETQAIVRLQYGPESWKKGDYHPEHKIVNNGTHSKNVTASLLKQDQQFVYILISCNKIAQNIKSQIANFLVTSSNNNDPEILSPITISLQFKIHCALPAQLSIFERNSIKTDKNLFSQVSQISHLRNNKRHELDVFVFDEFNQPFWNSTSLEIQWTSTDATIGKLVNDISPVNELTLVEKVGQLKVKAKSKRLLSNNLQFSPVKDVITVHCFEMLDIEPKNSVLYYHRDNFVTLKIINGSGNFDVQLSEDSADVAMISYDSSKREIRVKPKQKGKVHVLVIDRNLDVNNTTEAFVEIASIDKIDLKIENPIILKGKASKATVDLYIKGQQVSKDQLKFLKIELSNSCESDVVLINKSQSSDNTFDLQGLKRGNCELIADIKTDQISSNTEEFIIFNEISVFPRNLYLFVGCKAKVQIVGGPTLEQLQKYNYTIKSSNGDDFQISNLHSYFYEATEKVEKFTNFYLVNNSTGVKISTTILAVTVDKVNGLLIHGSQSIHLHAQTRIYAIPQVQNRNISPAYCPLQFKIKNFSKNILKSRNQMQEMNLDQKLQFSIKPVDIFGENEGTAKLQVSLVAGNRSKIEVSTNIQVFRPLQLINFTYLNRESEINNFMLLKPMCKVNISQQNNFEHLKINEVDNCARLLNQNTLVSNKKIGFDILVGKHNDKISSVHTVRVQEPFQMISTNSSKAYFVANNTEIDLKMKYLDSFGRVFNDCQEMDDSDLLILNSNDEVADYFTIQGTSSIKVNTKKQGNTYIFMQDSRSENLFEIVQINVGSIVHPNGKLDLHIGSTVQFKTTNDKVKVKQNWQSSDQEVVEISKNGHLNALQKGQSGISINDFSLPFSNIAVKEITYLKALQSNTSIISNYEKHPHYRENYEIFFEPHSGSEKVVLSFDEKIHHNFEVECKSDFQGAILKTIPMSQSNPLFGCRITLMADQKTLVETMNLAIVVSSNRSKTFEIKQHLKLRMIQQIFFTKNISKVHLTVAENEQQLILNSYDEVELSCGREIRKYIKIKSNSNNLNQKIVNIKVPKNASTFHGEICVFKTKDSRQSIELEIDFKKHFAIWSYLNFFNFSSTNLTWFDIFVVVVTISVLLIFLSKEFLQKVQGGRRGNAVYNSMNQSRVQRNQRFSQSNTNMLSNSQIRPMGQSMMRNTNSRAQFGRRQQMHNSQFVNSRHLG